MCVRVQSAKIMHKNWNCVEVLSIDLQFLLDGFCLGCPYTYCQPFIYCHPITTTTRFHFIYIQWSWIKCNTFWIVATVGRAIFRLISFKRKLEIILVLPKSEKSLFYALGLFIGLWESYTLVFLVTYTTEQKSDRYSLVEIIAPPFQLAPSLSSWLPTKFKNKFDKCVTIVRCMPVKHTCPKFKFDMRINKYSGDIDNSILQFNSSISYQNRTNAVAISLINSQY